jgi:hypothetical protein
MNNYSIFDTRRPILGDEAVVQARTAKDAAVEYLQPSVSQEVRRGDWGTIVITKFVERDGFKYQRGNKLVFGLITKRKEDK